MYRASFVPLATILQNQPLARCWSSPVIAALVGVRSRQHGNLAHHRRSVVTANRVPLTVIGGRVHPCSQVIECFEFGASPSAGRSRTRCRILGEVGAYLFGPELDAPSGWLRMRQVLVQALGDVVIKPFHVTAADLVIQPHRICHLGIGAMVIVTKTSGSTASTPPPPE